MRPSHFSPALLLLTCAVSVSIGALAAESRPIAEARFIPLGGIQQWVTIRGADRSNPVLLFLHGGPGDAQSALTSVYSPLENDFVLVQWDQRGAGRTLGHSDAEHQANSLPRLVEDGVELTRYIRSYLHTNKVLLVGHSWGSFLGAQIVHREPSLFRAFVGIAQVVSWREIVEAQYRYTLAQARGQSDAAAVQALEALGGPPLGNFNRYLVLRLQLNRHLASSDVHVAHRSFIASPQHVAVLEKGAPVSNEVRQNRAPETAMAIVQEEEGRVDPEIVEARRAVMSASRRHFGGFGNFGLSTPRDFIASVKPTLRTRLSKISIS